MSEFWRESPESLVITLGGGLNYLDEWGFLRLPRADPGGGGVGLAVYLRQHDGLDGLKVGATLRRGVPH